MSEMMTRPVLMADLCIVVICTTITMLVIAFGVTSAFKRIKRLEDKDNGVDL